MPSFIGENNNKCENKPKLSLNVPSPVEIKIDLN
jgi:hypothetical protein